jgi:hypothetical protein
VAPPSAVLPLRCSARAAAGWKGLEEV